MPFEDILAREVQEAIKSIFGKEIESTSLTFQTTRREFEGDLTLVVFQVAKSAGSSPEQTGQAIGDYLVKHSSLVSAFSLVKGFLNLVIHDREWVRLFDQTCSGMDYGIQLPEPEGMAPVLVEYSSPNTNKPLHLGHIRNNLLGFSVAGILKANGKKVFKVNLVNDRGIHICKSMLAWLRFGNGETPEMSGIKGDHLVGKYYVEFDRQYKKQVEQLVEQGIKREEAEKAAPLMKEIQEMLRRWEEGDPETINLWKRMNGWVYDGFRKTYEKLGVDFDKFYYESETYLLGKVIVEKGLAEGIFFRKADGSVWVDLTDEGLDQKLLLRADGTSVYITQDIGTASLRFEEFKFEKLIYVVANEQDYHFKVLKLILKKLGFPWWDKLYHLNYGMVDLPSGKMKSREGTVVDADELMDEMVNTARDLTLELGKMEGFSEEEARQLFYTLGMGALKYFILKVDPDKKMLFNPAESVDFNGNTGPFIQYTYARIRSVIRKAEGMPQFNGFEGNNESLFQKLPAKEKELIIIMLRFPEVIREAGARLSPALLANYAFELVRAYNQFYHEHTIADVNNPELSKSRLNLSLQCSRILKTSTGLLGIKLPERM